MQPKQSTFPAIGTLLTGAHCVALIELFGREMVTYALRQVIDYKRAEAATGVSAEAIVAEAVALIRRIVEPSLKPVINATGVVLHTNLGRAALGQRVLAEIAPIITGYANIEFDLVTGRRGHRVDHIRPLLQYLTGAQDVAVVNNNAAAIILVLRCLANRREVIISRGELIEIGGAFRIPEIMRAAGARMVEVGTTNRTRLSDFQKALSPKTALIFKAHTSNYTIKGFTEEASVAELSAFSRAQGIPFVYDIGSGLLRKPAGLELDTEPDVKSAVHDGADLVTFSADKLLGGPQAGIVVGRRELVERLAKDPLMRAVRVGKLTLAALAAACRGYLADDRLAVDNPTMALLEQEVAHIERKASALMRALVERGVEAAIVASMAQCGGGTLPEVAIASAAVEVVPPSKRGAKTWSERLFHALMQGSRPIVGIQREGAVVFDVFAIAAEEIVPVAEAIAASLQAQSSVTSQASQ
jgi:L-seryl-tRNA(Ser) seleniumtransferase